MKRRVRVAIDAMGHDLGPEVVARGAAAAAREMGDRVEVILAGDESAIWQALESEQPGPLPLFVVHAPQTVEMGEKAKEAFRTKPDSSIAVCARLVRNGRADALVSMGNTGAVVATSLLSLGRMRGIRRPAIASTIPTAEGACVVLDVGANAENKPLHLYQFALMGRLYAQLVLEIPKPRVGLLNIGEEPSKGNALSQAAHHLLAQRREQLDFIGNVEGRDIFEGKADVVVCDGFTGNVILKMAESIVSVGGRMVRQEIRRNWVATFGALLMTPAFHGLKSSLNYEEYGGALLLGTRGVCVIGHGRSSPLAIRNAIKAAARAVNSHLEDAIHQVVEADEQAGGAVVELSPAHVGR